MRISKESCRAALAVLTDAYSGTPIGIDKDDLLLPIALFAIGATETELEVSRGDEWDDRISLTEEGETAVQAEAETSAQSELHWPEGTADTDEEAYRLWQRLSVGEVVNSGPWKGWAKVDSPWLFRSETVTAYETACSTKVRSDPYGTGEQVNWKSAEERQF